MALPPNSSQLAEQADSSFVSARRVLVFWHLASLDAPTIAVVWTQAFAWAAGVPLDPWILILIACGTWTVYVGDRLLDARRGIGSGNLALLRERHFFHWRNRRKLLPIAAFTATISAMLILRLMPLAVREHDSVIAGAALAYFSGVHFRVRLPAWFRWIASKELLVGVLFTAGCAAPAFAHLNWRIAGTSTALLTLACAIFFAVLAWLNCAAIDNWESSRVYSRIQPLAALICITGSALAMALSSAQARAAALIGAGVASALLLLLLDRRRNCIAPLTLRALADLVLLTPIIPLALGTYRG